MASRRRRLLAATLACTLCTGVSAQDTAGRDGAWRGSLGASHTAASGNNESLNASLNADAVRRTGRDKIALMLHSLYGRRDAGGTRELTASLFRAGARYDRDLSEITYGFVGYDAEKNKLADLKWRHSPSFGAGLHLRRTDSFTFDVFAGYAYNREELYSGDRRSFDEALLGEETTHKFLGEASFRQRLALHPNLSESGEYRLVFDAGLVAPLVDRLSLAVNYSVRYQSNPPTGIEKRDTLLFTGLQYRWGAQ